MVTATILTSPDPQVWSLLGLPAPVDAQAAPASLEGRALDSDGLEDFLL